VTDSRFAPSTITGACKACGTPVELPIPIRVDSRNRASLRNWPRSFIKELFCTCGEPFPLSPFPLVYWEDEAVYLVLDGPRKANVVLRMVLSWIVDDERWSRLAQKQVIVFADMEDFAYKLENPSADLFLQDAYSMLGPDDVFMETSALLDFVDAALSTQKCVLAYCLLANVIRSCPPKWTNQDLREALEVAANACGDEMIAMSGRSVAALEDFNDLRSVQMKQIPFEELLDAPVWSASVCDVETKRPREGTSSGVMGEAPNREIAAIICCSILTCIETLRNDTSEGAWSGESKAAMTLRMVWPNLDQDFRETLFREFSLLTNNEFRKRYKL
jgi:hypothetical protein